jgi:hypothetical protein
MSAVKSLPADRKPRRVRQDQSGSGADFLCALLAKPVTSGFFSIDLDSLSAFSNEDKINQLQCIMISQFKRGRAVAANLTLPLPLVINFRLDGLDVKGTAIPAMPSIETSVPNFGYNIMASSNSFIGNLATVSHPDLMKLDVQYSTIPYEYLGLPLCYLSTSARDIEPHLRTSIFLRKIKRPYIILFATLSFC